MNQPLLLASGNPGKLKELQNLLTNLDVHLVTPKELGIQLDVVETGSSYAENAALKANAFASASGVMTLADDSGLEVDSLNGAPGIRSARYAPQPGATDADRRSYLLRQLEGYPPPWQARFRCVIVIASPEKSLHNGEGVCEGEIIPEARGLGGFGYDPIFLVQGTGRTMAELAMEEKNRLSHRALAVQAVRPLFARLLSKK